jgi:ABC-type multidrug transport system ATPase subunit
MAPPNLLILDEPFAGLDEQTRAELPLIISEIAAGGGMVVVSDHQNQLQSFPGADHWLVENGAVTSRSGGRPQQAPAPLDGERSQQASVPLDGEESQQTPALQDDDQPATPWDPGRSPQVTTSQDDKRAQQVVIEVLVDADDADEVEQKLRADGYLTRRTS